MPKLTKTIVDAAKPDGRDRFIWDDEIKGFGLRVTKAGSKSYVFQYRVGGGRKGTLRRPRIGAHGSLTPAEARGIAKAWALQVAEGGDPGGDRTAYRNAPRMTDAFIRYQSEHADVHKKASSAKEDKRLIGLFLKPEFGTRKVAEVSREQVSAFHRRMNDRPYQANRLLALLSKVFNLCEVWSWRPDGSNPCRHVKKFKEEKRERFLSPAELGRLGEVLAKAERFELQDSDGDRLWVNPSAIIAIRLIILTGARRGEILGLKWSHIDWDRSRALLADSKTGRRDLYLPAPALKLLADLRPEKEAVFVVPGGHSMQERKAAERPLTNLKDPWRTITAAAGLKGVRIHDLRHSFASVGASSGMGLPIIGKLLGHRESATTARYAHLADDPVRAAADTIGGRVHDAMSAASRKSS
jgi:integrase